MNDWFSSHPQYAFPVLLATSVVVSLLFAAIVDCVGKYMDNRNKPWYERLENKL